MPTLTQQELTELEALIPQDIESYTTQDAIDYYTYLSNKGFTYADLALQIVQNDTGRGEVVNAYAKLKAEQKGIDFDVGGDNWNAMRFGLDAEGGAETGAPPHRHRARARSPCHGTNEAGSLVARASTP